ncbi:MAG: hypothetical protein ABJC13_11915 [Acidobacteriota bacterium]
MRVVGNRKISRASLRRLLMLALPGLLTPLLTLPAAEARQNYSGNVVGQCVMVEGVTYNVVATTSSGWSVSDVGYRFAPLPATSASFPNPPSGNILYFSVTPGAYTVTVSDSAFQASYSVIAPDCVPGRKGMTWVLATPITSAAGTIRVGCAGCDPRHGDTPCTESLPILCIRKSGAGFPLRLPSNVNNSNIYNKWSGGVVATTSATTPPESLFEANAICARELGINWRVAEFHDGWGWYFQAYGGIGDPTHRFWVHINDQPGGNCWH